jgi:K+-transporting ATPase ATPase C chain
MKVMRPVIVSIIVFTILTGALYPLLVTAIAQIIFPLEANGSLIMKNGKLVGSTLIGQTFDDPKYFWGRLSATSPYPYNSAASSGSNLSETNPDLLTNAHARIEALKAAGSQDGASVPVDLATASGSGLDPHISPASAEYQIGRVAKARRLDVSRVRALVARFTENRTLGLLGEPRINVLKLNLALDGRE